MLKISVIIPAYNAENTIRRCIGSLLASSYEAMEVIVVDDGSVDNTSGIIEEFITADSRIMLITQTNAGPSAARNKGINAASGDILTFVDSDDYVEPSYFETLSDVFSESNADVVFFEFNRVTNTGTYISSHRLPELPAGSTYYDSLIHLSEADIFGYTWIKAFRRKILDNVYFKCNMCLFEDEVFTCCALSKPLQLQFVHKALYNYVSTDMSSLARRTHENYQVMCNEVYLAWKDLLENCEDKGNKFLLQRAKHMQMICKYYGLERSAHTIRFFKKMSNCEFVKNYSTEDKLVYAIKNKCWPAVYKEVFIYRIKLLVSKIIKLRNKHEKT